ncbi:hypothetical protein CERSUDRAFT_76441 [Gelatoporia subvermispora B]|uniref:Uncharacterized protein n=1 Tax=Ceriporiopsis subvermispora (strain B) TaxID=914234 RepID=M2QNJ8_CERS8|nr:hypothetical protein CERSUDRAFT_76441 [Gelatoporia subvermispora B]
MSFAFYVEEEASPAPIALAHALSSACICLEIWACAVAGHAGARGIGADTASLQRGEGRHYRSALASAHRSEASQDLTRLAQGRALQQPQPGRGRPHILIRSRVCLMENAKQPPPPLPSGSGTDCSPPRTGIPIAAVIARRAMRNILRMLSQTPLDRVMTARPPNETGRGRDARGCKLESPVPACSTAQPQ